MKTVKKCTVLRWFASACLILCMGLLASCDSTTGPIIGQKTNNQPAETISENNLPTDVKLQIQYDEKTYSFNTQWPADMVAGNIQTKSKSDSPEMILEAYENRQVTLEYDTTGHLREYGFWPEGDAGRSMPKDLYDRVKSEMPAPSLDYDPIVRWQTADGQMTYFAQSGKAVLSVPLQEEEQDPSSVPSKIDSVVQANKLALEERVNRNILNLKTQGISFDKIADRYALLEVAAQPEDTKDGITGYKQLLDLTTGQVIREATRRNGQYASFRVMQYKLAAHYPVLAFEQTYFFGKLANGQWGVKRITITNRENLKAGYRAKS